MKFFIHILMEKQSFHKYFLALYFFFWGGGGGGGGGGGQITASCTCGSAWHGLPDRPELLISKS